MRRIDDLDFLSAEYATLDRLAWRRLDATGWLRFDETDESPTRVELVFTRPSTRRRVAPQASRDRGGKMRRILLALLPAAAVLAFLPSSVMADSATHTYELHMEGPNFGEAANGDRVTVTGEANFSVHPKSIQGEGTFTHTDSRGTVRGRGTWETTELLDYQSYGCGIVHFPTGDVVLPDNFCGGKVKYSVVLTTPHGQLSGTMTVICIIGPNPPESAFGPRSEGVMLDVPGVINFNHSAGGDNIIVQTS